jgi:hypothetical protein
MRLLVFSLIIAVVITWPFIKLKHRWAVGLWRKVSLLAMVYVLVIVLGAIIGLVTRWDAIYG